MILSFQFNYVSKNGVLENLLSATCKEFGIPYSIQNSNTVTTLYVEDEAQRLEEFANFMAQRVPLSIFFKSSNVEVVENRPDDAKIPVCSMVLPFTPKTLIQVRENNSDNFMNPFVINEVGLSPFDASTLIYEDTNGREEYTNTAAFGELFEKLALSLKKGERVAIHSASGDFVLWAIDGSKVLSWQDDYLVMPCDLSVVEKVVVAKENELKALASLEKPAINMRLNTIFRSKELLPTSRIKVKLADDLILQILSEKLFSLGVELICKEPLENHNTDVKLFCKGIIHHVPHIEVIVMENGEILIVKGDGYASQALKDNLQKFENPGHAQFSSVIQEHELFGKVNTCFYFSKNNDDKVMHLSEKTGMLELVNFPIKKSIKTIFDAISESKTGAKLVDNFKEKFPQEFEFASKYQIDEGTPQNIYSMWGIIAVICGISQSIDDGSKKILELAEDFGGDRGPRVDYFKEDEKSLYTQFNLVKMVRSAMSFRLAGTDDITLSFGLMEALAFFIGDSSDFYKEALSSQNILLTGSLFSSKRFSELVSKNVLPNHNICFNRELPIDN